MPCAIPSARTAVAVNESAAMALLEPFAPRSVDFARSASQNDGLHRCLQAISTREDIRMETFEWVLRLRPDVIYGRQLPFAAVWPRPGHAAVAFVDSPRTQICCDDQKGRCQASAVCVNDVWALLSPPSTWRADGQRGAGPLTSGRPALQNATSGAPCKVATCPSALPTFRVLTCATGTCRRCVVLRSLNEVANGKIYPGPQTL